ncbi:uncharacterized protein LDX57_012825 [Aspergillus melleus]|uniref:uncharacterized protein n=1 Tax=Aspergillus melleus TaxID=138277 RepID=UPI001E8E6D9D|nr:uncharacterized protein LDX57_012825 [Aspergillus melleus]KAH8435196.1 hypothetical protein LDX57_012825 [Aspergillus melleus]
MSNLTDLSHKEPSTQALIEKSKEKLQNARGGLNDPDSKLRTGVSVDKSKAPVQQDLGKGSTQRAQYSGGGSASSTGHIADYTGIH